ncbi:MAG: NAD(P)/FAD-dependent oxidoreductase [Hymenobacteraceae bacterium]|nr:NAD(P)/FAD-dependent oxidoreductase [Hymenobacteraceae bacterium]
MHIVIVGGGAAGFFAAVAAAEANPRAQVTILEKTTKLLAKVRVSGGGRCNVTHACLNPTELVSFYPRGGRRLRNAFRAFGPTHTIAWFAQRGVALKTEADGRMFPVTDSSQTIIACLLDAARRAGVVVRTGAGVRALIPLPAAPGFLLTLDSAETIVADRVIIASGGHPKAAAYAWLTALGHTVAEPVPSLFTFNVPDSPAEGLPGLAVSAGTAQVAGEAGLPTTDGPLLITHWGFSGPAVLKLSAWGARRLAARNYQFTALLSWAGGFTEDTLRAELARRRREHSRRVVATDSLPGVPLRLWRRLTEHAGADPEVRWADLPARTHNRLVEQLLRQPVTVRGKTTFKEEFVTCGGIELDEVDLLTFASRRVSGLFFAGEVLDIDALTGGFNFQAAWTTGYLAGRAAAV